MLLLNTSVLEYFFQTKIFLKKGFFLFLLLISEDGYFARIHSSIYLLIYLSIYLMDFPSQRK